METIQIYSVRFISLLLAKQKQQNNTNKIQKEHTL